MKEKRIDIPKGYEFAGVDDDAQQVVFTQIQPEYPKTYEECFNICFGNHHPVIQVVGLDGLGNNKELFENFIKLKICRDAYWKIAGEQLGLSEPWKPDYTDKRNNKYSIWVDRDEIVTGGAFNTIQMVLTFPSQEMRDAFYENFKELIEECKEFL